MNNHHKINYIEFNAPNLETIKTFYSKVFDWSFTDYGPSYIAFTDGTLEGGFAQGKPRKASQALVIVYSENLESSLKDIEEAGGAIIAPIYSFPGGRRFHFSDPASNVLAVWSE